MISVMIGIPSLSLLTDHKTFKKVFFFKNASQSVGHGWEVVEKYISGQKERGKENVMVTKKRMPCRWL